MKTFKADYISILTLAIIIVSTPTTIVLDTDDNYENIIAFMFLFLICGVVIVYLLKDFSNISITDNGLIINFLFKRTRVIKNEEVKGLIYKFEHDQRTKYSWKEIHVITKNKKEIRLRKLYFFNFFRLEAELRRKYTVLVPATETKLTLEQQINLDKEIFYFDKMTIKRDIIWGTAIGLIFILLSLVFVTDNGAMILKSTPVTLLGVYFIYTAIKNGFLIKELK
jgi:hypothetical protein